MNQPPTHPIAEATDDRSILRLWGMAAEPCFSSHSEGFKNAKGHGKDAVGLTLDEVMAFRAQGDRVIGLRGGTKCKDGTYLLTIDADADGIYDKLKAAIPPLAGTLQHLGSKPGHFIIRTDERVPKQQIDLPDGKGRAVDILGHGAIAALPPSIHRKTGKPYTIVLDSEPVFIPWEQLKAALIRFCESESLMWVGTTERKAKTTYQNPVRDPTCDSIKQRIRLTDLGLKIGSQSCPFAGHRNGDAHPSFNVNDDGTLFFCHSNTAHGGGDVFTFMQLRDGVDFPTAKAQLMRMANIEPSSVHTQTVSETELRESIPSEVMADMMRRCDAELQVAHEAGQRVPILLRTPYPLTWFQVMETSRRLTSTQSCDTGDAMPVLVLPTSTPGNLHPKVEKSVVIGKYCVFEAQVVLQNTINDKRVQFEPVSTYEVWSRPTKTDPEPHMLAVKLRFTGDDAYRTGYKQDLSYQMEGYTYQMQSDEHLITVYSQAPLELGQVYRVAGLVWSAPDKSSTHAVANKQNFMLVDWSVMSRDLVQIDEEFFGKFRGLTEKELIDAVCYPYETSIEEYKRLPYYAVFHVRDLTDIPFNIMLMGEPGLTKSCFLEKLSAISGDRIPDNGAGTVKGLMPSFAVNSKDAGALCRARYFALVNEFFETFQRIEKTESKYTELNRMKMLLEGKRVDANSGNGNMSVRMRASTFMASNWVGKQGGRAVKTVSEIYEFIDGAILDRIMIFPVNADVQKQLVASAKQRVKGLFTQHQLTIGKEEDPIEVLKVLADGTGLRTRDFRTILVFKEKLLPVLDADAADVLTLYSQEIVRNTVGSKYSRISSFISNIASATAFSRALREGSVKPTTRTVQIGRQDVIDASEYVKIVIEWQHGRFPSAPTNRAEFARNAELPEKLIIQLLKERWMSAEDMDGASIGVSELYRAFREARGGLPWANPIFTLLKNNVVLYDGDRLLWLPDGVDNAMLREILVGGSPSVSLIDDAYKLKVAKSGKYFRVEKPPVQPIDDVQNDVRRIVAGTLAPASPMEIALKMGIGKDVVENALRYMHLTGTLRKTGELYQMNP